MVVNNCIYKSKENVTTFFNAFKKYKNFCFIYKNYRKNVNFFQFS